MNINNMNFKIPHMSKWLGTHASDYTNESHMFIQIN